MFLVVILDDFQSRVCLLNFAFSYQGQGFLLPVELPCSQHWVDTPIPPCSTPGSPSCSPQVKCSGLVSVAFQPVQLGDLVKFSCTHGKGTKKPFWIKCYLDGYQVHSSGVGEGWQDCPLQSLSRVKEGFCIGLKIYNKLFLNFKGERKCKLQEESTKT